MRRVALVAVLLGVAAAAHAQALRPSQAACDRTKLAGRAYVECLDAAVRDADRQLTEAMAHALAVIDARADLAPTQRTRWKNSLEEAQGMFVRLRNLECQAVAPYEGAGGRIGSFEERLACLVDKNTARAGELAARYPRR